MHLKHLGLPVADVARSRGFYEKYFGFDPATARRYDDGTVILRGAGSFDLALHTGGVVGRLPSFLHFGFRVGDPEEVRTLRARMRADGVDIVEEFEEQAYVGVKCLDPDGFTVETYWEPT